MTRIEHEQLFNKYQFIVGDVYRKLNKNNFILTHKEDIEQEGLFALWKGVLNYEDKGLSMFSFLYACVQHRILNYLKTNQPKDYLYSLDYELEEDNDYNLHEFIVGEDPTNLLHFDLDFVLCCYKTWLTKKYKNRRYGASLIATRIAQATLILKYLVENKTYRDIEKTEHINRTICSNIMKQIREAIRVEGDLIIN